MKNWVCTKVQLDLYTEVRDRLNGKCSYSPKTCPRMICEDGLKKDHSSISIGASNRVNIFCPVCHEKFPTKDDNCPCESGLPDVISRLELLIEELQDKVNKRFS